MSIDKDLTKKYGDGVIITGDKLKNTEHKILHISPKIDMVLGGGVPGGVIFSLAGLEKCGKSVTALHAAGNAQKDGRKTYYVSVEARLRDRDLDGVKNLDKSKLHIIKSFRNENGEGRILCAEEFLDAIEKIVHNEPGSLIILDSLNQLVSQGELEKNIEDATRAPMSVVLSRFLKRISNAIAVNDIILIVIQQLYANVTGYGRNYAIGGGNRIRYSTDIGLLCRKFDLIKEDNGSEDACGQSVNWTSWVTAITSPGKSCVSTITYGIGIDEIVELTQLAIDFALISKAGSWYSLDFLEKDLEKVPKVQGEKGVVDIIRNNPTYKEKLEKLINNMIYSN